MFFKCFFVKENVKKEHAPKSVILCYKSIHSAICLGKNKTLHHLVCMYLARFRNCSYVIVFTASNYK